MLFAAAGGEVAGWRKLEALPDAQVLTEFLDPYGKVIQPGVTRCENRLGGRVAVLANDLHGINASSIFSYRKKEIVRQLLQWLNRDEPMPVAIIKAPNVFVTFNRHKQGKQAIVTINNLCADTQPQLTVRCHPQWVDGKVYELSAAGEWQEMPVNWQANDCIVPGPFEVMRTRVFKLVEA